MRTGEASQVGGEVHLLLCLLCPLTPAAGDPGGEVVVVH